VFVVAEHTRVLDRLLLGLSAYRPVTVRGGQSDAAKSAAVDAFNCGDARVLVGQVDAAGVGFNLHGDGRNTHVVVVQLPWTPAQLVQAEDRLHRIGQTGSVEVEIALCSIDGSWTIDERLWGLLETKNFSATSTIDGVGEWLLEETVEGLINSYRS
jgi:SNF2 family DNA or RNA helicase